MPRLACLTRGVGRIWRGCCICPPNSVGNERDAEGKYSFWPGIGRGKISGDCQSVFVDPGPRHASAWSHDRNWRERYQSQVITFFFPPNNCSCNAICFPFNSGGQKVRSFFDCYTWCCLKFTNVFDIDGF